MSKQLKAWTENMLMFLPELPEHGPAHVRPGPRDLEDPAASQLADPESEDPAGKP